MGYLKGRVKRSLSFYLKNKQLISLVLIGSVAGYLVVEYWERKHLEKQLPFDELIIYQERNG